MFEHLCSHSDPLLLPRMHRKMDHLLLPDLQLFSGQGSQNYNSAFWCREVALTLFNVCSNISNFQFSLRPATWIISSINPTQDHQIYYIIQVYIGILPKGMVKLSPNSLWDGQFVPFLGNEIISVVSNPPPWWQLESFIQPTRVSGFHKVNSSQTSSPTPFHVATAISVLSSRGAGELMILKTFPTFWLSLLLSGFSTLPLASATGTTTSEASSGNSQGKRRLGGGGCSGGWRRWRWKQGCQRWRRKRQKRRRSSWHWRIRVGSENPTMSLIWNLKTMVFFCPPLDAGSWQLMVTMKRTKAANLRKPWKGRNIKESTRQQDQDQLLQSPHSAALQQIQDLAQVQAELQNVIFFRRSFLSNQIFPKKKRVNRDRFFTFKVLNGQKKQIYGQKYQKL